MIEETVLDEKTIINLVKKNYIQKNNIREKSKITICKNLYKFDKLCKKFDQGVLRQPYLCWGCNTAKTRIGVCFYNKKKCFYKYSNGEELKNYKLVKKYYNVPKFAVKFDKYIIYEYIKDFENNTINDYLYTAKSKINFKKISNQYNKSIGSSLKLLNTFNCESKRYFFDRRYMLSEYIEQLEYKYLILNEKKYDLNLILDDIIKKISLKKNVYCFVTPGDPTDTNITSNGHFTDLENCGYNSMLSELSIIFVSLFSHGRYFYPKYNKKAYVINTAILKTYKKYNIKDKYNIHNKNIYIDKLNFNLPPKNKEMILDFINIYLKNPNYKTYCNDFIDIKYYICMRFLTPLNINDMEECDKINILTLVVYIYTNIINLEELKNFIEGE